MTPSDLKAPSKFTSYRKEQAQALDRLTSSSTRIDVAGLPVGVGKTLLAYSYASLMGMRAVWLTGTKGLQDQIQREFAEAGVGDTRGMSNYPCRILEDPGRSYQPGCDAGPCLDGQACPYRERGCGYYDAWRQAKELPIVVTNYDAWFSHPPEHPYSLGERHLIIADEAHTLSQALCSAVGVEFDSKQVKRLPGMEGWEVGQWSEWAHERRLEAEEVLKSGRLNASERRKVRGLHAKFSRLAFAGEDWATSWDENARGWRMEAEPISPAPYVEGWLWRGAEKIVLMSGTIRPGLMKELGYEKGDYTFFETRSPFPLANRPIYRIELGFNINARTQTPELEEWMGKQDQIHGPRAHLKGIVHTVSYARARWIYEHSRYKERMIMPLSGADTREAVERFKRSGPGNILLSPSVHTGWDFPGDEADYQIICKVPFADTRDGLAAARKKADPHWDIRNAIMTLQQAAGRVVRTESDKGETFILDDAFKFLWSRHKLEFSHWFVEAYQVRQTIPGVLRKNFS